MTATETKEVKTIPPAEGGQLNGPSEKERLYTLKYRSGGRVFDKNFPFKGNLKQAIDRAREHCRAMGIIFILVNPLVVDLEYQERVKKERGYYDAEEHGIDE